MTKVNKAIADHLTLAFYICVYSISKLCVMAGTCFSLGKQCQQAVPAEAEGSEETVQEKKKKKKRLMICFPF